MAQGYEYQRDDMIKHISVERLVFIDKVHKNLASERRKRGWALRGTRARREQWAGRGTKYSVLSACTVKGFVVDACHAVEKKSLSSHASAAVPNRRFRRLGGCVFHVSRCGSALITLVVSDNCSIHHAVNLEALVAQKGARVVWLPPYR